MTEREAEDGPKRGERGEHGGAVRVTIAHRRTMQFASLFAPYGACPKFSGNSHFAKVRR